MCRVHGESQAGRLQRAKRWQFWRDSTIGTINPSKHLRHGMPFASQISRVKRRYNAIACSLISLVKRVRTGDPIEADHAASRGAGSSSNEPGYFQALARQLTSSAGRDTCSRLRFGRALAVACGEQRPQFLLLREARCCTAVQRKRNSE